MVDQSLVQMVRGDLQNAMSNTFDMLTHHTDREIADDLLDCTTGYERVDYTDLVLAIAQVRKEGLYAK